MKTGEKSRKIRGKHKRMDGNKPIETPNRGQESKRTEPAQQKASAAADTRGSAASPDCPATQQEAPREAPKPETGPAQPEAQGEQLRTDILNAASVLFGKKGYQAVSVDAIAQEASVAKRTLYRYFKSKDELVLEYLGIEAAHILNWLRIGTESARTPLEKIKAFFSALAERTASPRCRGCAFQMVLSEYPDADHAANRLARRHKEAIRAELQKWSADAGFRDIAGTVHRLYVLMEGAWACARLRGTSLEQVPVQSRVAALNHAVILLTSGGLYAETLTAASSRLSRPRLHRSGRSGGSGRADGPDRPEGDEEAPVDTGTLSLFEDPLFSDPGRRTRD